MMPFTPTPCVMRTRRWRALSQHGLLATLLLMAWPAAAQTTETKTNETGTETKPAQVTPPANTPPQVAPPVVELPPKTEAGAQLPPQADKPPTVGEPLASTTPAVSTAPVPAPAPTPPTPVTPVATAASSASPTATKPPSGLPGTVTGAEEPGGNFVFKGDIVYDFERGIAVIRGPVTLNYRAFALRADRGRIDFNSRLATLSGNLRVSARNDTYSGQTLIFNIDTGHWELSQVGTKYPPEAFPTGTVLEPIYVHGATVTGKEEEVEGSEFRFTSCDRDHYFIEAKHLEFYADKSEQPDRIVLRHNAFYVFHQKVLPLPVYVISLKGGRSRRVGLQPTFGQNAVDGFFVRSLYDLNANRRFTDSVLIDALQKRGLGLGLQRELAHGLGLFYIYALSGKTGGRQIDTKVQRLWRIRPWLASQLNYQSSKNNSLSNGGISNENGNLSFTMERPNSKGNLIVNYASTGGSLSQSQNTNAALEFAHRLHEGVELKTSSLLTDNDFAGTQTSTLDNTVTVARQGRTFDSALRTELHNGLTGLNEFNGAYQLERVPEFALLSNTDRLHAGWLQRHAPADVNLTLGTYNEPSSQQRLSRAQFQYNGRSTRRKLLQRGPLRTDLATAVRFQQDFYTNNTARYNYGMALGLENKLGRFGTQFNYVKQKALGFTPFLFDFLAPGESLDANVSYEAGQKVRANLSAGRDLQNHVSRDLIGRLQLQPSRSVYASFGANYSPSSGRLGDLIANLHFNRDHGATFGGTYDVGLRYTPQSGQLAQINVASDFRLTRKTQIQTLAGYNGIANQFDFAQIRVVQDLHCFNLYTTYDRQRRELRFDLAIKAFPFADTRLGQNQFGSGFDPRIGGVQ